MGVTDAQLLRRAREDPEALAELYLRYRDRLYAWFRSRLPEAAASELTAELFAQVALSLKRFRDEAGGSAAPWLFGIAKNLVRRYHESGRLEDAARRRLGMPIRSYEEDFEAVDERLAAAASAAALRATLDALPKLQREALELRVLEELSYEEVAGLLGCSEGAARLRVMRALGRLAQPPA
ncbi:MAG TPA: RNA polymerase sigma factor [Gaiellaceae bacterium]|nr:RNA polymerase sigma factor [Gaiellaceae bacterium]